jgi:transcription initiation factor TFIIB
MAINIVSNLGRNGNTLNASTDDLCATTPSSFIERYCSRLNMNSELTKLAKFIAKKIEQTGCINDNTPHSIASGIVYFVAQTCNSSISKTDVKQVCGVSEVTINKCFKKMELHKEKLVPQVILHKYQDPLAIA